MEKCIDDGGTCGLGGFCNDCPNLKQDKKMSRELSEILEELNLANQKLTDQEAEVTHAEMNRDEAKSNLEDAKHELEVADYQVFKKWLEDNT